MSVTSQKKDLTDNEVIKDFAKKIKDLDTLNYMYCLTAADVSATNPKLWNSWNASLLKQLYDRTKLYFEDEILLNTSIKEEKAKAMELLEDFRQQDVRKLWSNFYEDYFEASDHKDLQIHAQNILLSKRASNITLFQKDTDSLTTIFINTQDRANLFATIIGILDSENINFVDAKLFGMKNGYCTDLITISDNGKRVELDSEKAKVLIDKLEEAISPRILKPKIVQRRQPRHLRHFKTDTEISFKHDMKNRWTDLEISTTDRPGLLASICQVFLKHGALIKKARIATYGEKAEDRFSITSKQDTPFIKRNDLNNLIEDIKVSLN